MADLYISVTELKAFRPDIAEIQTADVTYLSGNVILRTKLAIDRYCFREFDTVDTASDMYLEVQLAQKILGIKLFLRERPEIIKARQQVGVTGGENKGDWSYNLAVVEELIDSDVKTIIDKHRDWTAEDALKLKLKTGRHLLEGDLIYEDEINR